MGWIFLASTAGTTIVPITGATAAAMSSRDSKPRRETVVAIACFMISSRPASWRPRHPRSCASSFRRGAGGDRQAKNGGDVNLGTGRGARVGCPERGNIQETVKERAKEG